MVIDKCILKQAILIIYITLTFIKSALTIIDKCILKQAILIIYNVFPHTKVR